MAMTKETTKLIESLSASAKFQIIDETGLGIPNKIEDIEPDFRIDPEIFKRAAIFSRQDFIALCGVVFSTHDQLVKLRHWLRLVFFAIVFVAIVVWSK